MDMRFEHIMDVRLSTGAAQPFGQSEYGRRIIVPITGGVFAGSLLRGRVVPGGSDWQLVRPDGTTRIDARYTIETLDGIVVQIANRGVWSGRGNDAHHAAVHFTAPPGRLDWLNKHQFVAKAALAGTKVTQRLYKVV